MTRRLPARIGSVWGQEEPVDVADDQRGEMMEGDVVAADAFDRLEQIVEGPRVVIEEHHLLRMLDRPRGRLRAEDDVIARHVEPLEPRDHVEVKEEVPEKRHVPGIDVDPQITHRAGVRVDLDQVDLVPAVTQSGRQPFDDDLEAAGGVEIGLGNRDLHSFNRATSASSSATRSASTNCAWRLCSRSRASASSARTTSRFTSVCR